MQGEDGIRKVGIQVRRGTKKGRYSVRRGVKKRGLQAC